MKKLGTVALLVVALSLASPRSIHAQGASGLGVGRLIATPWVIARLVSAAIAIPVAVHDAQKSYSP